MQQARVFIVALMGMLLSIGNGAFAHETDQFTTPGKRTFADLSDYFTQWAYDAVAGGVERTNARIAEAQRRGDEKRLRKLQSPDAIAEAVRDEFPWAMDLIEDLEKDVLSRQWYDRYPGRVVGYKVMLGNTLQGIHLPVDPRQFFRIWLASTIKAYDVHFGTDKIGHFADMGMNFYRDYRKALGKGMDENAARAEMLKTGTHDIIFSESGVLGYLSAGAYSNADLASDYAGFLFYKNLTEAVVLADQTRPPMLELVDGRWVIADHVGPDTDFFSYFISDHWDEALNPSHYEGSMRGAVRKAITQRSHDVLYRYRDANGCLRSPRWFVDRQQRFTTFWGAEYGHKGDRSNLLLVGLLGHQQPDEDEHRNVLGLTPLHLAVIHGDHDQALQAMAGGSDVNAPVVSNQTYSPEWGNTPLHYAVRDGSAALGRRLIASGADVDARSVRGATPLHRAGHSAELAGVLIDRGAEVNAADRRGRTPLYWVGALAESDPAVIGLLARRGADANMHDNHGRTPLHDAAQTGSAACVRELLRAGATVDTEAKLGMTPLHLAAERGDVEVVEALLDGGSDADRTDAFGYTPLHTAAREGHHRTVAALLRHGADPNAADADGNTPMHLAARYNRPRSVALMVEHGGDVDRPNDRQLTAAHEAAFAGNPTLMRMLEARGADVSQTDHHGRSPRDIAAARGHEQITSLLADEPDDRR